MANLRALAMQHIGRPVVVHTAYGVHRGILHHIDDRGLYLQMYRQGGRLAAASDEVNARTLDQGATELDVQSAWWIWPFFFIPWAAAWALAPWWGPYWW